MNEDSSGSQTRDLIPTRYSLLSRLRNWEDQESWQEFFDTYWRLIYSVARKSGLSDAEAQEVVQETVLCVARNIDKFKRDRRLGSFKGWLCNLTRWRIADQLRKRTRRDSQDEPSNLDQLPEPVEESPDSQWDQEWQEHLLQAAISRVKLKVREEHYQMFHLQAIQHWPVSRVAQTLGVSAAQVYLARHRVTRLLQKEVRALEKSWERPR
jgi:RNA polymerase sigma-70 factor (ECF subfamily)